MNLRATTDHWLGMAAELENQAASFERAGSAQQTDEVADAEAALRARIQAVNYRAAADQWRRLVRHSGLLYRFEVDDPVFTALRDTTPARAWVVTPESPPQMFVFQAQVLNLNRALTLAAVSVLGLIGTAGTLWWLL